MTQAITHMLDAQSFACLLATGRMTDIAARGSWRFGMVKRVLRDVTGLYDNLGGVRGAFRPLDFSQEVASGALEVVERLKPAELELAVQLQGMQGLGASSAQTLAVAVQRGRWLVSDDFLLSRIAKGYSSRGFQQRVLEVLSDHCAESGLDYIQCLVETLHIRTGFLTLKT
jgi:hypothetical protein